MNLSADNTDLYKGIVFVKPCHKKKTKKNYSLILFILVEMIQLKWYCEI